MPDHDRLFFDNFVNAMNSSDLESLTSSETPKLLKPNTTLERAMRLYSQTFGQQRFLVGPGIFQTSNAISGMYLCRSENNFGTRSTSVNITVEGLNNLFLYTITNKYITLILLHAVAEGDSSVVYIRFLTYIRSHEFVEESVMLAEVDAMVRVTNINIIYSYLHGIHTFNCRYLEKLNHH